MKQLELFDALAPPEIDHVDPFAPWWNGWIAKEYLIVGEAYYVKARHFRVALWSGTQFYGLRYKYGAYFVDGQYHYDDGPPFGTVKPYALLKI